MSGPDNLSNWQASRISNRQEVLEHCILEYKAGNTQHKCISDLAKYLAKQITILEQKIKEEKCASAGLMGKPKPSRPCTYTALLRRAEYRVKLDELMDPRRVAKPLDDARKALHKARCDLLTMRNRINELEHTNNKLRIELDRFTNPSDTRLDSYRSELDVAYLMMKALISRDHAFLQIDEEGNLVEDTVTESIVINHAQFRNYLNWCEERYKAVDN
ncbi:hypothetical protein E8E95_14895 [Pseudomonas sp. BN414]|uniref:hypothetical protein n=1 Tax=Pseudomonas sp. BN414 TaxID=2567888 RepID=UPI002454773E|nr:hypothetical protein [Pseudomonas sp. BN414]MDH4567968.1 hypothetical protein [Pseudomonas sp. BN414]